MELRYPALVTVGGLLALAAAVVLCLLVSRRRQGRAVAVANSDLLTDLPEYRRALRRHRVRLTLLSLSAVLLGGAALVGAARPVDVTVERPETRSRDIMLCLDISGSMAAYDAELMRTFSRLVTQFEGERIGLVIFNSSAATVFPLTDDYDFIRGELHIALQALLGDRQYDYFFAGTFNGLGTSLIGDGLASCVASFDRVDTRRARSVVFATDNHLAGRPILQLQEAIELAKLRGVRVYGLNPEESGQDEQAVEMRDLVRGTAGDYYAMSDRAAVDGIVAAVAAQEATLIDAAARRLLSDSPDVPVALAGLGLLGVVVASRRRGT
ncbi:VWA domain-containing protein [Intrasporangium sp. DVR]|uniref:vWA domain-containing protein n=1 Tax=Intrasporangium sp. DVR TaxID=3127867 RepID=UPI00313A54B6